MIFEPRWNWYRRGRLGRRGAVGGKGRRGTGPTASSSEVEADARHDARRSKCAQVSTSLEPSNRPGDPSSPDYEVATGSSRRTRQRNSDPGVGNNTEVMQDERQR